MYQVKPVKTVGMEVCMDVCVSVCVSSKNLDFYKQTFLRFEFES